MTIIFFLLHRIASHLQLQSRVATSLQRQYITTCQFDFIRNFQIIQQQQQNSTEHKIYYQLTNMRLTNTHTINTTRIATIMPAIGPPPKVVTELTEELNRLVVGDALGVLVTGLADG